jgi:hypothetical protein
MANRLLRYELTLFRRSFADAFDRKRDRLLLLLVAVLALLWLREQAAGAATLALPPGAVWLAAAAAPIGFAWQRLVLTRLALLSEHSAVAANALDRRERHFYFASAHLLALVPLGAAAAMLAAATGREVEALALATLAYALGLALASVRVPASEEKPEPVDRAWPYRRRRAALNAILQRQTLDSRRPERTALLIVLTIFALTAAAAWFGHDQPGAGRIAAILLPSLLGLALASRIDSGLLGFLPFAGYPPSFVACAVAALPAANLAASVVAVLLVRPPDLPAILAVLLFLHAAIILAAIARAWLYPGRNGRSVDLQVQAEFAGLLVIAVVLPPLALFALVWRLAILQRHCRSLLWVQS